LRRWFHAEREGRRLGLNGVLVDLTLHGLRRRGVVQRRYGGEEVPQ
jgi:hypothetical protein